MGKTKNEKKSKQKSSSKLVVLVVVIAVVILLAVLFLTREDEQQNVENTATDTPNTEVVRNTAEINKEFSASFLVMNDASIADTKEDVIQVLGDPEKEEEKETLIPEMSDLELSYDNGETKVIIRNGRVEQIESTNKNRIFAKGVRIGMTEKEVEEIMPADSRTQNSKVPEDSIVYAEYDSEDYEHARHARFIMEDGKVSKVILSIGE